MNLRDVATVHGILTTLLWFAFVTEIRANDEKAGDTGNRGILTEITVNQPSVISNLNGDSVGLAQGETAVTLDANADATLEDADSADFSGGNFTATIVGNYQNPEDSLLVGNVGNVTISGPGGSTVNVGPVSVGMQTFDPTAGTLVVALTANATAGNAQAVLRAVQYLNFAVTTALPRTIRLTADDGDGGISGDQLVVVTFAGECAFESGFENAETNCN